MSEMQQYKKQITRIQIAFRRKQSKRPRMQGLRQAIYCQDKMTLVRRAEWEISRNRLNPYPLASVSPTELPELISALQSHFEKVQTDTAFLALKQSELRSDDHISLSGMMDAREQLSIERSLLAGHVFMIQEMITRKKVKLDMQSYRQLRRIVEYTRTMSIHE